VSSSASAVRALPDCAVLTTLRSSWRARLSALLPVAASWLEAGGPQRGAEVALPRLQSRNVYGSPTFQEK
jgi:hypothetical protein